MGQVRRVLRELASKKLNETQPGFGQQPKPSSGKLVGEPLSFDRQIGASATGRAKAQWGQRPRSLPPSKRGGHPELSEGAELVRSRAFRRVPITGARPS